MSIKLGFIAYPSTNIKRSRAFFEGVLGLKANDEYPAADDKYWVEYDLGNATLGVGVSPQWPPSDKGASAALEVDDIDTYIEILKKHDIPIVSGPNRGDVCDMVVIQDPDGNKITLHHKKGTKKAKAK
ncbi:MAG: VOC family protein [Patescibacteria group bacterium]|nr:VOC family protein [Patescibacteria group bacterium]